MISQSNLFISLFSISFEMSALVSPVLYISSSNTIHQFHWYIPVSAVGSLENQKSNPWARYFASFGSSSMISKFWKMSHCLFQYSHLPYTCQRYGSMFFMFSISDISQSVRNGLSLYVDTITSTSFFIDLRFCSISVLIRMSSSSGLKSIITMSLVLIRS